eukprot:gene475-886_t
MNRHTFKDVVTSKRQALVNDLDEDDDDQDVAALNDEVDGEEEEGRDKFNEIGEVIEPFNLRNEREAGHFDTNMNFVWKKERVEPDAWLADMDEATMEKSIGEAADAMKRKQALEASTEVSIQKPEMQLKYELLKVLRPGENVLTAMRRLGGKKDSSKMVKRRLPPARRNNGNNSNLTTEGVDMAVTQLSDVPNTKAINELTDIADQLISLYHMSYEAIEASLYMWEYKGQDGLVHGPYTTKQISEWRKQGFFAGPSSVLMRKVKADSSSADVGSSSGGRGGGGEMMKAPNKKRKFDNHGNGGETGAQELIDDLEEDDDDEDPRNGVEERKSSGPRPSSATGNSKTMSHPDVVSCADIRSSEPWLLSDDIDFGDFVTLTGNIAEVDENEDQNDND